MSKRTAQKNTSDLNEEINLTELIAELWKQKTLIILISLTSLVTGISYTYLSPPIYHSQIKIHPGTSTPPEALQTLKLINNKYLTQETKKGKYSDPYIFSRLVAAIKSTNTKRDFSQEQSWDSFQGTLVTKGPNKKNKYLTISLETSSAVNSALWLKDYIQHSIELTQAKLSNEFKRDTALANNLLDLAIFSEHNLLIQSLDVEISKLTEAFEIAKSLNITAPLKVSHTLSHQGTLTAEMRHLYSQGTNLLGVEIQTLVARKNKPLTTPSLLKLQSDKQLLASLEVNPEDFLIVANTPETQVNNIPIKPRKTLIITFSLLFGFIFSCFIALIRSSKKS